MTDYDAFGLTGRRRVRRDRRLMIEAARGSLPTFDDETHDKNPYVLEVELVVSQALGRWATNASLHGEVGGFLPYRSRVSGYELFKLLGAATYEDADQMAQS